MRRKNITTPTNMIILRTMFNLDFVQVRLTPSPVMDRRLADISFFSTERMIQH